MKITEKQLIMLVETLKDTLAFHQRDKNDPFCFSLNTRSDLLDEILNQQSNELREIK